MIEGELKGLIYEFKALKKKMLRFENKLNDYIAKVKDGNK